MEIQLLTRFLAVVENGNFALAARKLNITPQALSVSVSKLEKDLGVTLFDRERGGITRLNSFGEALVSHARGLVSAQKRAVNELQAIRDGRSGWLRIGVGEGMTGAITAEHIAQLKRDVPDVQIMIRENYTSRLIQQLEDGEIDVVAGAPNHSIGPQDHLEQIFLFKTRDVVAVRPEHPLARRKRATLEDMLPYTWLVPYMRTDSYKAILNAYIEQQLDPPRSFIFSDSSTVGSYLLRHQDYLLMVTRDLIGDDGDGNSDTFVELKVNELTLERHACLIYRRHLPQSPVMSLFCDRLIAATAHLRPKSTGIAAAK
jgi:DNA-binding transcriptional LysR family regulator